MSAVAERNKAPIAIFSRLSTGWAYRPIVCAAQLLQKLIAATGDHRSIGLGSIPG
jgi:hypothetical protein